MTERVVLDRSIMLTVAILAAAVVASVAVFVSAIPPSLKIAMVVVGAWIAGHAVVHHAMRLDGLAAREIEWSGTDGACLVRNGRGQEIDARLMPGSVVWPWLILVRLTRLPSNGRLTVVVPRDAMAPGAWRHLSTWARWSTNGRSA